MEKKGSAKLSNDERREMVVEALQSTNRPGVASRYGIRRETLYGVLRRVEADPEGRLEEARKEYEFRARVVEILAGDRPGFPPPRGAAAYRPKGEEKA